jgi:phosphatidylglycerophosphatase A
MRERLIKLLATGFGAGYAPMAPGTVGSVVGVALWWIAPQGDWIVFSASCLVAVWCAGEAARLFQHPDPACVVIDEIVAVPVALAGVHGWWLALAFGLFRLFDVWKPWPIRQSQKLPGGWGIVVDDLLAAAAACGVTHAVTWLAAR